MREPNTVSLIPYTAAQERANCITHAIGAAAALAGLCLALRKALPTGSVRLVAATVLYGLSFLAVYTISAVYHGLPPGNAKRTARRLDHIAIPLLLAGTATPCALIPLHRVRPGTGIFVFCLAWACAAFGVAVKLFFFENAKLKVACMAVYFIGGAVMLGSAVPLLGQLNRRGFALLLLGCLCYAIGAAFCRLGMRRPWFHPVFHVFVLLGSLLHFYTIYTYML